MQPYPQRMIKERAKLNYNKCNGSVVVTTDGGAGSSGKGSFNAWLAVEYPFHLAMNNWSTNAGHYWESDDGLRILNQHICSAFVNPNTELYINAGASIDIDILFSEIFKIESHGFNILDRLSIHPHANVITQADKDHEKLVIKTGSTFKGCGSALARKTMRVPGSKLAKDYEELGPFIKDRTLEINEMILQGANILIEGSQGIDLDINHAEYPYITSRQTIPQQLIADAGIPIQAVSNIIINLRTNPIRINNQSAVNPNEQCYTGNYWDAKEISWADVASQAGYDSFEEFENEYKYALMTSVTKKLRRVFEFPKARFKFVHHLVGGSIPDSGVLYSLNFVNFVDKNVKGAKEIYEVTTPKVVNWLQDNLGEVWNSGQVRWLRTGARHSEIVDMGIV